MLNVMCVPVVLYQLSFHRRSLAAQCSALCKIMLSLTVVVRMSGFEPVILRLVSYSTVHSSPP